METALVRDVSRSFYLSLRALPEAMREPVSLAYLLARASDTLADTEAVPAPERLELLDGFIAELEGGAGGWRRNLHRFIERQTHAGERILLERLDDCLGALDGLSEPLSREVRGVVGTITSGQRLDLERFGEERSALPDAAALDDYCHRVAGCVGVFWTRVGFMTLGRRFSREDEAALADRGEAFGRGLQLVNILRDLPKDLDGGRCYLPVRDPSDREEVMREAARWRRVARQRLADGRVYAGAMRLRRLKVAVGLPALLGEETLDLLDAADGDAPATGVKVDRATVYRCAWRSLWL